MKLFQSVLCLSIVLSSLFLCGCVNGRLSPGAAAVIKAVDVAACAVLEARLPTEAGRVVGDVCEADKPILDVVLGLITAPKLATKLAPAPAPRPVVRCGARAIGHVDLSIAAEVQDALNARPECQ